MTSIMSEQNNSIYHVKIMSIYAHFDFSEIRDNKKCPKLGHKNGSPCWTRTNDTAVNRRKSSTFENIRDIGEK